MGFLNHSTNNIIIDAVLTERGREALSNGNFEITQFSFGDDEVDYSNITKYGKIIGKEKIEKNTPIFEASTNENIALKNKLLTLSSRNISILYLPLINAYVGGGTTEITTALNLILTSDNAGSNNNKNIKIQTFIDTDVTNSGLDTNLIDRNFLIRLNSELLDVRSSSSSPALSALDIDQNLVATYRVAAGNHSTATSNSLGLREVDFNIFLKSTMTDRLFSKYGRSGDSTKIDTSIQIIGEQSNSTKIIKFEISKTEA